MTHEFDNTGDLSADQAISPKPVPLTVIPESIPDELKAIDQWVVWRYFWQKGKWDKPPLQSHSGNLASTTSPKTWNTFNAAIDAYHSGTMDGVGFVFAKKNCLVGIDLDHCRNAETGIIDAWAQEIIRTIWSYTELSPSGTGIHIIGGGTLPGPGIKTPQVEMYDSGRFFTVTGHHLEVSR